jgi:histidyl-tRNA synthetase
VAVDESDHPEALAVARDVRALPRVVVEQDLRMRGVKSALRYADRAGFDLVVITGERERADNAVLLRNMRTRQESRVARADVASAVEAALA